MASEVVFSTRLSAGASTLLRNCDVLRSITNSSDELNMVCIRIGTEIVWTHVLHSQCTVELLGPVGIPVVKTQYHDTCILCEHDVDVQCVQLPKNKRKELAQTEPLYSGDIMFVAGEARSVAA
jgi:hypothetical protein